MLLFDVGWLAFFRTVSQILTAGIAITAFSLLLYALTFNLRDRVTRSFALILGCVVVAFTADALGSTVSGSWQIAFWLKAQWIGIIFLPAAYLHFSDALLATTGRPSRWRRLWAVRFCYLASFVFLLALPGGLLVGPAVTNQPPAPYLQRTLFTDIFILYYVGVMSLAMANFVRAYLRTRTATSRRRMAYLIAGGAAPALGTFPFLLFSINFSARHTLLFWVLAAFSNLILGGLIVVMAYSVAFFGVPWPDRVVKARLFKWLMRGPATASITLALVTIVRRTGELYGQSYTALVPIIMVGTILLCEYVITLFAPFWQGVLFYGKDQPELTQLHSLEDRLLSRNDLGQFLEMVLAALCDRLQAPGAFVAALNGHGLELVVTTGKNPALEDEIAPAQLYQLMSQDEDMPELFQWGDDYLIPLVDERSDLEDGRRLLGVLGISSIGHQTLEEEQVQALGGMTQRVLMALRDRRAQKEILRSLQTLSPQVELIQRMRAAGRYESVDEMAGEEWDNLARQDMTQWVKDALAHYWGGPKLTESPLLNLQVVKEAAESHEGNTANALRAILREAIERVRPEGERRFTGEWILYNILEMKFLEGRKVREVALRLAMSEADLYRKQRVAIEAVVHEIQDMEIQARQRQTGGVQSLPENANHG